MKIVIFGLTISSSWGNGHATIWRGLCKALSNRGHDVVFMERDVPYYAAHRDLVHLSGVNVHIYPDWSAGSSIAEQELQLADVMIITSYCPDGIAAAEFVNEKPMLLKIFYDMDTPITLQALAEGRNVFYLDPQKIAHFDQVLTYTGGRALEQLICKLGARNTAPLYGCVDPEYYIPTKPIDRFSADLSYLGTYAEDRQTILDELFLEPSRRLPDNKFIIGGSLYPEEFPWTKNTWFAGHVSPPEHPSFYCSSRFTLNVTRSAMANMGFCPSGRFFEAAACAVPVITDSWEGMEAFFEPNFEIIVAKKTADVLQALTMPEDRRQSIAQAGLKRVLAEHTCHHRAAELERILSCL